jgi:DNA-binding transcriptional LysR family regulator
VSNAENGTQRSENEMDLRQLQYLVAVAEELNFTRAAQRCTIAQSGLSHQIAQLEKELGAALFHRTSRTVALTPEGRVFLPYAHQILRAADDARGEVAALRGVVRGRLRIGSIPVSYGELDLLGLLRDFRRAYPAIDVSLSDEGSLSTVSAVLAGEVDVAFVGLFAHQVPPGLLLQVLTVEPLVAVVGREHPLRGAGVVSLGQLVEGNPFLESHADSGLRTQVDEACARARARRQVVCELRNPADLAALALQGIGVAVVPHSVGAGAAPGEVSDCVLRLDDARAAQPVAFVHRDPEPRGAPAQAFLRLSRARWPVLQPPRSAGRALPGDNGSPPLTWS